mmetsp:Transcript_24510/g.58151  ORF Transcript_24510/g.58151 Transcript_24510/m.58151 type:complete len:95 (+) Transcript_24510:1619-1903(+)
MYNEDLGEDMVLETNLFCAWTNRVATGDVGAVKADASCVMEEEEAAMATAAATITAIDVADVEVFIFLVVYWQYSLRLYVFVWDDNKFYDKTVW